MSDSIQQLNWDIMQSDSWPGGYQRYRSTRYLMFYASLSESGKTAVIVIYAKRNLQILGHIKWYSQWRQYALFPEQGVTVWNDACLAEVQEEIQGWRATRS